MQPEKDSTHPMSQVEPRVVDINMGTKPLGLLVKVVKLRVVECVIEKAKLAFREGGEHAQMDS